jgi:hypothetical protein
LLDEVFVEAADLELEFFGVSRKVLRRFLGELEDERSEGGVGLGMGDAGLEANAGIEGTDGVVDEFEGKVDIAIAPREAGTGDADDGVVFADELDGFAEDAWI